MWLRRSSEVDAIGRDPPFLCPGIEVVANARVPNWTRPPWSSDRVPDQLGAERLAVIEDRCDVDFPLNRSRTRAGSLSVGLRVVAAVAGADSGASFFVAGEAGAGGAAESEASRAATACGPIRHEASRTCRGGASSGF